ncbi:hypothetical protein OSTOST_25982, partial [Ostertagia ostertagi]
MESIKKFFRTIIRGEDVDYAQFESKMDGTDIVTFRENDKAFRLFGTNVHVKTTLQFFFEFPPQSTLGHQEDMGGRIIVHG